MIKVEKITNLLELVVFSAYLKGEQPVSALITAPVESGKTEVVMRFAHNTGCAVLTDATAYGIMRDYGQLITDKKLRHIIIPDLVKQMSRGKDTVHTFIAFLNSLIEEGVYSISTYAEKLGAPTTSLAASVPPPPVKCGLIATLAKNELLDGRHRWSRIGFMSRLLPISYEYSPETEMEIHQSIASREYLHNDPITLNLPSEDIGIKLESKEADELLILTSMIVQIGTDQINPEKVYGFRLQKHIQRLAMASALNHERDRVTQEDIQYVRSLSGCINLRYSPV